MLNNNIAEIEEFLTAQGQRADNDIALFETALAFSALRHPEKSLGPYYHHLNKLTHDCITILASQGADHADAIHQTLKAVIADKYSYQGAPQESYDLLDHADICYVIDHRQGLPVALSIIYLEICHRLDWPAEGVNFPGHFLLRLSVNGQQILFDPYHDARIIEAPQLRELIKSYKGPDAELSQNYYQTASDRDILLRLQNNIKNRQISAEDYSAALETVLMTEMIAPDEYRLLLDKGVLLAKCQNSAKAIDILEQYISRTPNADDKADARMFIEQIHQELL